MRIPITPIALVLLVGLTLMSSCSAQTSNNTTVDTSMCGMTVGIGFRAQDCASCTGFCMFCCEGSKCYNRTSHVCTYENKLCPIDAPISCGQITVVNVTRTGATVNITQTQCYRPNEYVCTNGNVLVDINEFNSNGGLCGAGSYYDATFSACLACPAGTAKPNSSSSRSTLGVAECTACPAGSYNDVAGATTCKKCKAGTFSNVTGSAKCLGCAVGAETDGSTTCSVLASPSPSPTPSTSPLTSPLPSTDSNTCIAGMYRNSTTKSCLPCPQGSFSAVTNATVCEKCAINSYSEIMGATSCKPCPAGTSTTATGATICTNTGNPNASPTPMPSTSSVTTLQACVLAVVGMVTVSTMLLL